MQTTCEHFSSFQPTRNYIIRPATTPLPNRGPPLAEKVARPLVLPLHGVSSNSNPARDLPIALPVGALLRYDGITHGWLYLPVSVDGPRSDGVLARRGILPIQVPELPRELLFLSTINGGRAPWSVIDANIHTLDWPAPGRTINSMHSVLFGDLYRDGFQ